MCVGYFDLRFHTLSELEYRCDVSLATRPQGFMSEAPSPGTRRDPTYGVVDITFGSYINSNREIGRPVSRIAARGISEFFGAGKTDRGPGREDWAESRCKVGKQLRLALIKSAREGEAQAQNEQSIGQHHGTDHAFQYYVYTDSSYGNGYTSSYSIVENAWLIYCDIRIHMHLQGDIPYRNS